MSGLDPISAALADSALTLGFPIDALTAQLTVGELVQAVVLAPQAGRDLVRILGQTVVADLPAGIFPGEVLNLEVTGFSSGRMYVRNLGPSDPESSAPDAPAAPSAANVAPAQAPPPAIATQPQAASGAQQPATPQTATATPQTATTQTATPPVAPPRAVFVAASVRPAPLASTPNAAPARAAAAQPIDPRVLSVRVQAATRAAVQTAADVVQRTIRTTADALRLARVPDTPIARTAAAIAPQAASRLPGVLARLESALPENSEDPRIASLRTIAAFVARLAPQNEETLAAQIASYVSHAVQGGESKLAQLLEAAQQTAPPQAEASSPQTADRYGQPASQNGTAPAPAHATAPDAATQIPAQARVAERTAAISHDLKSLVLSLLRDPPQGRTPALAQALNETLVTLSGVQIHTLVQAAQDPEAISLTLPLFYREGGSPAQIRITRDRTSGAPKLDGDNFHVAFVLDTENLGTVAIDVQTAGRSVKLDVKTERANYASEFSKTLDALKGRLEHLRYRVTSLSAGIAPRPAAPPPPPAPPRASNNLDTRA